MSYLINMTSLTNFSAVYPSPIETCSISAWIAPTHGFIDFECGPEITGTVGFYPKYIESQLPNGYQDAQWGQGSSIFRGIRGFIRFASPRPGILHDDKPLLEKCMRDETPCLVSQVVVSPEKASKAWAEMKATENEVIEYEKNSATILKKSIYKPFGSNCIDFLNRIMASTNVLNWKQKLNYYASTPTIKQRLFSSAWNYLNWT